MSRLGMTCMNTGGTTRYVIFFSLFKRSLTETKRVNIPENARIRTACRSISFICSNEKSAHRITAIKSKDRGECATINLCAQA